MRQLIEQQLQLLPAEREVRILYACESGSRAWGFPSTDSDFDVRFIYCHSREWYLSIDDRKDTIELPVSGELDLGGWELRKALQLFRGSNPVVFEWLQSPIVYQQTDSFAETLRQLMADYANPRKIIHHHLGLIRRMLCETEAKPEISLKKYFYLLRSLFSAVWVRDRQSVPPMEFAMLRNVVVENQKLNELLDNWLTIKRQGDEKTTVARHDMVDSVIRAEAERCEHYAHLLPSQRPKTEPLDRFFRQIIAEQRDA
jgi:uncharacterized protein